MYILIENNVKQKKHIKQILFKQRYSYAPTLVHTQILSTTELH